MRLRTIAGLVLLGLFLYAWLWFADAATGGCDDGCSYTGGWSEDPNAAQWTTQLWLARAGVGAAVAAAGLWLLRRRAAAIALAIPAAILFCAWYPIAGQARFGP